MRHTWPILTVEDEARVLDCLRSGRLWLGDAQYLPELERRFGAAHGARHALALTNGTHALEVALGALGIGFGDEVLVPAFTFVASATSVLARSALPIPIEVDPSTFCLDPADIAAHITERTKAIIAVHLGGHPCPMDEILAIARHHGLRVIEDCAQAHGATYRGQPVGVLGDIGTFSFQAGKAMTAGEGGMLLTNDVALWRRAYSLANCGRAYGGPNNEYQCLASNYRMPEMLAALLIGQLDRLAEQTRRREQAVAFLAERLKDIDGIEAQGRAPYATSHTHSLYMLRYRREAVGHVGHVGHVGRVGREELIEVLSQRGFAPAAGHPLFHQTPFFATLWRDHPQFSHLPRRPDYANFDCPTSRRVSDEVVWFRHSLLLCDEPELLRFARTLEEICGHGHSP